jgi:hypothetical protein
MMVVRKNHILKPFEPTTKQLHQLSSGFGRVSTMWSSTEFAPRKKSFDPEWNVNYFQKLDEVGWPTAAPPFAYSRAPSSCKNGERPPQLLSSCPACARHGRTSPQLAAAVKCQVFITLTTARWQQHRVDAGCCLKTGVRGQRQGSHCPAAPRPCTSAQPLTTPASPFARPIGGGAHPKPLRVLQNLPCTSGTTISGPHKQESTISQPTNPSASPTSSVRIIVIVTHRTL